MTSSPRLPLKRVSSNHTEKVKVTLLHYPDRLEAFSLRGFDPGNLNREVSFYTRGAAVEFVKHQGWHLTNPCVEGKYMALPKFESQPVQAVEPQPVLPSFELHGSHDQSTHGRRGGKSGKGIGGPAFQKTVANVRKSVQQRVAAGLTIRGKPKSAPGDDTAQKVAALRKKVSPQAMAKAKADLMKRAGKSKTVQPAAQKTEKPIFDRDKAVQVQARRLWRSRNRSDDSNVPGEVEDYRRR